MTIPQKYTIKDQLDYINKELNELYPLEEIKAMSAILFDKILNISLAEAHIKLTENVTTEIRDRFYKVVEELKAYKPIQYIFGETEFYGLTFQVNPYVLIPRPETEELVNLIIKDYENSAPTILDIGTGSGCIAVSLAKNLNLSKISAMDISKEAIKIAKSNAQKNEVDIDFYLEDILDIESSDFPKYNVIVSNPPYVLEKDKEVLLRNVTEYEPHLALFVNEKNPLIFYEEITKFASTNLNENGRLYFEINEAYGKEIEKILNFNKFKNIEVIKDINNKDRIIKATI